jgi:hypothetical protein
MRKTQIGTTFMISFRKSWMAGTRPAMNEELGFNLQS